MRNSKLYVFLEWSFYNLQYAYRLWYGRRQVSSPVLAKHVNLGGICVSRYLLLMDFLRLGRNVSPTRSNISIHIRYRSDTFALRRLPSSFSFLCHVKICIRFSAILANSLTNARGTLLFDCVRAYSKKENYFYQWMA